MKKYDPVLYIVLAMLFAASAANALYIGRGGSDLSVEVTRDGVTLASGRLDKIAGSTMTFGEPGNFNEITAGDGVRMTSADCPGGDCLRAGEIRRAGEAIVCVPHKLVVRLASPKKPDVDTISY
jgi:hypothetical protein